MERKARFFLNAADTFSPDQQRALLSISGSAASLLDNEAAFREIGLDKRSSWLKTVERLESEKLYENLLARGVKFLLEEDEAYPPSLAYIDTPPHLLYVKGQLPTTGICGLSVIGTRHPTQYGRKVARGFGTRLAEGGLTIISGCARGIDAEALWGAIEGGGQVIGVLGTGIEEVYPRENEKLFKAILSQGALISEFPPGAKPLKRHFPWRNRLISGWALGLLVVEASIRSGTAGTVRWALDQGKEVFAIPGPINSEASRGCHRMIREGAHLVEFPKEVLEFFGEELRANQGPIESEHGALDPDEDELGLIRTPRTIDDLMEISGLNYEDLVSRINRKVVKGHAERHPGGRFSLKS
mgnify:CR=1 FL=1|jgi:DNA processing protein